MLSKLRPRSVYDIVAALALFVALGGTAWAVAANSVGTPQLKNGAVKNAKIAGGAVTGAKVANGSIAKADLGKPVVSALADRCPANMNRWGELCADKVARLVSWDTAVLTCARAKLRLPSVAELYLIGSAGGLSPGAVYWSDVPYSDTGAQQPEQAVTVYGGPNPSPSSAPRFNQSYGFCVTNPRPG